LILKDDSPVEVRVLAGRPSRRGSQTTVDVELHSSASDGRDVLHASAQVILGRAPLASAPAGPIPAVERLNRSIASIYQEALFHGPHFQGLTSIDGTSSLGLIARSEAAPAPAAWIQKPLRNSWITDPLAIDAALQAIIVWGDEHAGAPSLPCAVDAYRQYHRSFPTTGARIVLRINSRTAQTLSADVDLLDERGELVATLTGCQFVLDEGLRRAFRKNELAQPILG
jgi:hypothetical protein